MSTRVEFLGRFESTGWKPAGQLTPIAYILWSVWLIAVGVAFLTQATGTPALTTGESQPAPRSRET